MKTDNQESLILQIQRDCLNNNVPVSQILRKAKVVATKLELEDFLKWLNDELDGYASSKESPLPPYRTIVGEPKGFNPYYGYWQSIGSSGLVEAISKVPINLAIGPMEETLLSLKKGEHLIYPYPPKAKESISAMLEYPTDVHLEVSRSAIIGIIDKIRNILLDWMMKLEKSGVLGEGLSFNAEDKAKATGVTQNFYADNIAVTGQVQDQASVTNIQNSYNLPLDTNAVLDLAKQIEEVALQLPKEIQGDVQKYKEEIFKETAKENPDNSRIRSLLTSLRTICEGASGNLISQGVVNMIGSLLAG